MLSRNKIYIKEQPGKDAKKIFIFCEGDREVDYFKYFKGFSSNIDIITIPNDNGKSDPEKLKEDALLKFFGNEKEEIKPIYILSKEYKDEIWFVIDTDRWNEGNKIENLKEFCSTNSKENQWKATQSNPCFEIWLYFHFYTTKPLESEIASSTFKEFVNIKIPGGFNSNKYPLLFQDAINSSENNFEVLNNQPKYLSTEVFLLAKSILPFIKETIDNCIKNQNGK